MCESLILRPRRNDYPPVRGRLPRALLLGAVVLVACGRSAPPEPVKFDPNGVAILPEEDRTKRITPQQVAYLRQEGVPFLFVDSRSRDAHLSGRPAGSVSIPLAMTELAVPKLPSDRLIVTFCT